MNLCELKGVHVYWFHIIYVYIHIYPLSSVDRSFLLLLSMFFSTSKRPLTPYGTRRAWWKERKS